jgi:hypothetical protein
MEVQQSSAMQRWSRDGQGIAAVRRVGLVVSLVVVFLIGATSVASASSFYWYGESPDCWQTGQPGSSGKACDYPGGSEIYDAVTGDLNANASGDYCNPYDGTIGQELSGATCANEDASWPLSFSDSTTNCTSSTAACGIQHYVSLVNQDDLPWSSSWFGNPALVISADLNVTSVSTPTDAWEYICPLLKAPEQPYYLELCFDEWQGAATQGNLPKPPFSEDGYGLDVSCAPVTVKGVGSSDDTLVSPFALNDPTPYATTLSGSTNTIAGGTTGGAKLFTAKITLANLENAINRDNEAANPANGGAAGPGYGCGRGLSSNLSGYQLVGVEDGNEGRPTMKLAATVSNLQVHTEYTPLPPEASTSAASEVEQTQAKFNGSVNPKGTDTHYYFEYGTTTSYGGTTSETDAGSGMSSVAASAIVGGLEPGLTYHYRIVAHSGGGTSDGGDRTVTIPAPMVAFQANSGELFTYSATAGVVNTTEGMWAGTSPSIAGLTSGGYVAAFNANSGELFTDLIPGGAHNTTEGLKTGTNPSVAALPSGSYVVAFQANTGELFTYSPTTGVVNTTEGMWPGTSPSVAVLANGSYIVAFTANTGELFTYSPTTGVVNTTEGLWRGTSPSVTGLSGGGYVIAFNANTGELFTDSTTSGVHNTTEGMDKGTNPSVTGLANGGYIVAFNANTGELFTDSSTAGVVNTTEGMWPGTSPSITGLPLGGYAIAFNANSGELFTDSTTSGVHNTTEGLKIGTNPSITR